MRILKEIFTCPNGDGDGWEAISCDYLATNTITSNTGPGPMYECLWACFEEIGNRGEGKVVYIDSLAEMRQTSWKEIRGTGPVCLVNFTDATFWTWHSVELTRSRRHLGRIYHPVLLILTPPVCLMSYPYPYPSPSNSMPMMMSSYGSVGI